MGIFNSINDVLYTNKYMCTVCRKTFDVKEEYDEIVVGNTGICLECIGQLPWISTGIKFFSKFDNETEIFSPLYYRDKVCDLIIDFKFHGMRQYASVLAYLIHYRLDEPHIDIPSKFDIITPVPLSKARMRERGYNQSALIAKELASLWNIEYCDDAITRIRNTKKQSLAKNLDERFANVHGAFLSDLKKVNEKRVLIIDDIYTHGYTMNECISAVKLAGATKVGAVTVALAISGKHMLI